MAPSPPSWRFARHHVGFAACFLVLALVFHVALMAWVKLSLEDTRYSHILTIPVISLGLLYFARSSVFRTLSFSPLPSTLLLIPGILSYWTAQNLPSSGDSNYRLSLVVLAILFTWGAAFVLCYGIQCFRAAAFPLVFLLFMIPLPVVIMDNVILLLQKGSAEVSYVLFKLLGIPVFRNGFTFTLPGVDIEVAKECSGIRSTVALLITGVLAGHIFLYSSWRKTLLALLTIPIAILKNAVRIVTISWLGVYVDRGFLHGNLHRYGGVPFALVALAILGPILIALQRTESVPRKRKEASALPISLDRQRFASHS
jgi:exosortase